MVSAKKEEKKGDVPVTDKDGQPAADGAPAEGAEGAEAGGMSKKKKIIIAVAAIVLLLIAGGAAAYFTGALDKVLGKKPDCSKLVEGDEGYDACKEQMNKEAGAEGAGAFIEIPPLIVNLSSTSKQPRFLKISMKVELQNKETEKAFQDILPRVIDQFQTYLRELRIEDLRGSSGLYRMKIELLNRVRAAAPDIKVRDVLFQEILVQ